MADVVVGSTFIGTVLEHAGYLAQERLLADFQSFFRDAGALVYLLAGAGAVVSVAVFGSFRAVRYLLLGPALFWFLVGPTVKTKGALWKIGGGSYLGELRSQGGPEVAADFRDRVMRKVAENKTGNLKVAVGFWLFAKPISDFVNVFVDQMLSKESGEDLAANHKVAGLELIGHALPTEAKHIQLTESFAHQCSEMVAAAHAAAELLVRKNKVRGNQRPQASATTDANLQTLLDRVDTLAWSARLTTTNSRFDDVIREHATGTGTTGRTAAAQFVNGSPLPAISCGVAWKILAEETYYFAAREVTRVIRVASGIWEYRQALNKICAELTRKVMNVEDFRQRFLQAFIDGAPGLISPLGVIGTNINAAGTALAAATCNLEPALSLAMLHNHLTNQDTWGRVIARHWNEKEIFNPSRDRIVTGPYQQGFMPVRSARTGQHIVVREPDANGNMQDLVMMYRPAQTGDGRVDVMFVPVAPIFGLQGMDHAMWVSSRQYEIVKLRQQIYTYAMQLPYYQGLSLYFIATIYPFLALIVLLPGRAQHFLFLPLAYLWVKSWDIGFAAVVILDKVMYNNLPSWNLSEALSRRESWTDASPQMLATMFSEGYNFDPMGSVHIYYQVVAMVTMLIPVLTGMATIRMRRGILSSFTDAAAGQAKDRANIAGNIYSKTAQNDRVHMMMHIGGLARLSSIGGSGGVGGGIRGVSGRAMGMITAGNTVYSENQITKLVQGQVGDAANLTQSLISARSKFIATETSTVSNEAKYESALRAAYDPNIGRSSTVQIYQEAYASAMDGGGGFELAGIQDNAISEWTNLYVDRLDFASRNYAQFVETSGEQATGAIADIAKGTGANIAGGRPGTGPGLMEIMLVGNLGVREQQEQGKQITLPNLKDFFRAQAYTDEEFLSRVFLMDRFTLADPVIRQSLEAEWGPEAFDRIFGVLTRAPAMGGPSSSIELHLSASGGNRFRTTIPDQETFDAAANAVPHPNSQMYIPNQSNFAGGLDQGMQQFDHIFQGMMLYRGSEYTMQIQTDQQLQQMFPGVDNFYQQERLRLRTSLMSSLGSHEQIASLWKDARIREYFRPGADEANMPEGMRTEVIRGDITAKDVPNLTDSELVRLVVAQNRYINQQMTNFISSNHDPVVGPPDPRAPEKIHRSGAEIQYASLPRELIWVAENNPRIALERANRWLTRIQTGRDPERSVGFGLSGETIMTTPGGFFGGSGNK